MTSKLWLIGMMRSGKTKVGRMISSLSGRPVVDVDDEIERRAGMSITRIFQEQGEPAFRAMEVEEVARLASDRRMLVVATGGGVILDGGSRLRMRASGLVIWLKPPIEALISKGEKGKNRNRPLLAGHDDVAARYLQIWDARKDLYEEAAHLKIPVEDSTRPEAAARAWEYWRSA